MAAIQPSLFSWQDIDILPDMKRLEQVLKYLPDEGIIKALEQKRGRGRNDYPVAAMWNAVIAGIVFQHRSIEGLVRELSRNPALLHVCGFDSLPMQGKPVTRVCRNKQTGLSEIIMGVINHMFSLHTPVTSAPNDLASCTANDPTPPDAPLIRTLCPDRTLPTSRSACRAASADVGMAASYGKTIACVKAGRVNAHQHLIIINNRRFNLDDLTCRTPQWPKGRTWGHILEYKCY